MLTPSGFKTTDRLAIPEHLRVGYGCGRSPLQVNWGSPEALSSPKSDYALSLPIPF